METVDQEIYAAEQKFVDNAAKDGKPFFVWFNTTRMHVWTHLKKSAEGRTGIGLYPDGMVEHDDMVGAGAEAARRSRHRRQHHRRLRHRQRRRDRRPGPTAARRRSTARRAPPGKAASACRCSCAGRA